VFVRFCLQKKSIFVFIYILHFNGKKINRFWKRCCVCASVFVVRFFPKGHHSFFCSGQQRDEYLEGNEKGKVQDRDSQSGSSYLVPSSVFWVTHQDQWITQGRSGEDEGITNRGFVRLRKRPVPVAEFQAHPESEILLHDDYLLSTSMYPMGSCSFKLKIEL